MSIAMSSPTTLFLVPPPSVGSVAKKIIDFAIRTLSEQGRSVVVSLPLTIGKDQNFMSTVFRTCPPSGIGRTRLGPVGFWKNLTRQAPGGTSMEPQHRADQDP
jgi:hypothetical protein